MNCTGPYKKEKNMEKILLKIKTLHKLVMRDFLETNEDLCNIKPPTPTQIQIMYYLIKHQKEKVYQKDLEKVLNLKRATISGVLQTMEKNNLIERITSKEDTRVKQIILNKKTKEIFEESRKKFLDLENTITKDLSEKEITTFITTIDKMINNLKKER